MSAETFLSSLKGVRQTGAGRWLARCPAHEDRSPSLSIRELADGRILIHDFGGCGSGEVLDALGLTLADLFPEPLVRGAGGIAPTRSRVPAGDVLAALAGEIDVAALITSRAAERREISDADWQRLALAAARIGGAAHGR